MLQHGAVLKTTTFSSIGCRHVTKSPCDVVYLKGRIDVG
jgi:hypothetical protein